MKYILSDNRGENPPFYNTTVEILYHDGLLTFAFNAEGGGNFCPYKGEYNANHYEGDVCELFIGNKRKYYEMEVAPDGSCSIWLIVNKGNFHYKVKKKIKRNFLTTERRQMENGYFLAFSFPEAKLKKFGEELYFNLFRIETDGGEKEKYLFALNRTHRSHLFHESEVFEKFPSLEELTQD